MRTELFIKIPTNEPGIILNPNFTDGLNNWTIQVSTADNEYGVCYPAVTGSSFVMYQDNIILKTGWYLVKFTIVPPKDGTLDGILTFGLAQDVDEYASTVGEHKVFMNVTTLTDNKIYIATTGVFNGGITNISIEGLDGDWKQLSLNSDEDIALTLQISDISDISSKNSSYSKTITLPGDYNNNVIFNHIYNISSFGAFELNKDIRCRILQDSINVFEGLFELSNVNINGNVISYEALVSSENYTLFTKMGDKLLRGNRLPGDDLDFSEYRHIMNAANIIASWDNLGSGYTYGCINKQCRSSNQFTSANTFKVDEMSPALFIKEIFDKILRKAGFTYQSEFLESDYFKSLVYPLVQRWMYMNESDTNKYYMDRNGGPKYSKTIDFLDTLIQIIPDTTTRLDFTEPYTASAYNSGGNDWNVVTEGENVTFSGGRYTVEHSGYYNVSVKEYFDLYLQTSGGSSSLWDLTVLTTEANEKYTQVKFKCQIIKKRGALELVIYEKKFNNKDNEAFDIVLPSTIEMSNVSTNSQSIEPIFSDTFEYDGSFYVKEGDQIFIKYVYEMEFTRSNTLWDGTFQSPGNYWLFFKDTVPCTCSLVKSTYESGSYLAPDNKYEITLDTRITEDIEYNPTLILHDNIKQSDFISSIIKMFNLYVEDIGNNTLLIEPRDDYYSTNVIKEWQLNKTFPQILTRASDLNEKVLSFSHDTDETRLIKNYERNYTTERIYGEYYKINGNNKYIDNRQEIRTIFMSVPSTRMMENPINNYYGNDLNSHISYLIVPVIYNDVTSPSDVDYNQKYKPTIFNFKPYQNIINTGFKFKLKSETTSSEYTTYPYFGHFSNAYEHNSGTTDLNFGTNPDRYYDDWFWNDSWATTNNLYNLYYSNMIEEYLDNDSKILTCYVDLKPKDIYDFRFSDKILIDGNYFRVNKIIDYVIGQPTKVELLTIKNQIFDFDIIERPSQNLEEFNTDIKIVPHIYQDTDANVFYLNSDGNTTRIATINNLIFNISEGENSVTQQNSESIAYGIYSMCQGYKNYVYGDYSTAEGIECLVEGDYAHAEGYYNTSRGNASHTEGRANLAVGNGSHCEGYYNLTSGLTSHAGGYLNSAIGNYSFVHGRECEANGDYSFSCGFNNISEGQSSISIGEYCEALDNNSVSIGYHNISDGEYSVSLGSWCEANGRNSIAIGYGSKSFRHQIMFSNSNSTSGQSGLVNLYCIGSGAYYQELKIDNTYFPMFKTRSNVSAILKIGHKSYSNLNGEHVMYSEIYHLMFNGNTINEKESISRLHKNWWGAPVPILPDLDVDFEIYDDYYYLVLSIRLNLNTSDLETFACLEWCEHQNSIYSYY